MKNIHVPREDESGRFYGHPMVYIGPRGIPPGRSWAVYVADGGAHDRHTVKALADTESEAASIAATFIRASEGTRSAATCDEDGTFSLPFQGFSPPFHDLFSPRKRGQATENKDVTTQPFHFSRSGTIDEKM